MYYPESWFLCQCSLFKSYAEVGTGCCVGFGNSIRRKIKEFDSKNVVDLVICGGGAEGHKLKKEVNFSDTYLIDSEPCRIPGSGRGKSWSLVNSHGWFSYEIKVKPDAEQLIKVVASSLSDKLKLKITIEDEIYNFDETVDGKKELVIHYKERKGNNTARIRFDRISAETPYIYQIVVE